MKRAFAVLTVLILLGGAAVVFWSLGRWLSPADEVRDVAVIVVPGGDPNRTSDSPRGTRHTTTFRKDPIPAPSPPQ